MEAYFYKNGNAHLKINQDFMKAFNIEAVRLNGWVRSVENILENFPMIAKLAPKKQKNITDQIFNLLHQSKKSSSA